MFHTSYIEISRSAYQQNLAFIRSLIGDDVQFSSVVKGNAYGHGIEEFVPMAVECGVRHFSVFSVDEAHRVHKATNGGVTILIMGLVDDNQMEWVVNNGIEFFVFDLGRLEAALARAKTLGKPAKVHIELETGMNRTGFSQEELPTVLDMLQKEARHLIFQGLCTHFSGAESIANFYRIKHQRSLFAKLLKKIKRHGLAPQQVHTACSAALLRYPKTTMDMVRVGILQYGFFPSQEVMIDYLTKNKKQKDPLRRLISWKSKVMDVKFVKKGEFVGYGTSYLANSDMKIALVPVGYSHGFSRVLSNQGRVLISGKRLGVAGTVNMNMMSIDVENIDEIKKGDEVVLIGLQGDQEISVASFSDFTSQINYELLTRLPENIPRRVVD